LIERERERGREGGAAHKGCKEKQQELE